MWKSSLIVLSGEAGAGKDSVAKILVEQFRWTTYSLAAPLKRFGQDMFGFTDEQLYGPSHARNAPDPRWARPCPTCGASGMRPAARGPTIVSNAVSCEACEGTGKINDNSVRRVLQLLGEEYLRQMIHVDALTIRALPELEAKLFSVAQQGYGGIVVTDARNDNDRNNLHDWLGGIRVDVRSHRTRAVDEAEWRKHISENRQPTNDQLEYVIRNDEEWPFPSLPARVSAMLAELYG
jgi:hypothetical protein